MLLIFERISFALTDKTKRWILCLALGLIRRSQEDYLVTVSERIVGCLTICSGIE